MIQSAVAAHGVQTFDHLYAPFAFADAQLIIALLAHIAMRGE